MAISDTLKTKFDILVREIKEQAGGTAVVGVSPYTDNDDGLITGRILASVTGTFYQGTNVQGTNGFFLKANPNNSGIIWIGVTGSLTNMFPLSAGDLIVLQIRNLNVIHIFGTVAGEDARWLRI